MALIDDLLERIAALEAQQKAMPGVRYRGPFRDGEEYSKGDIVTFRGSMWFCHAASAARPLDAQSSAWQLCVKAGRDSSEDKGVLLRIKQLEHAVAQLTRDDRRK